MLKNFPKNITQLFLSFACVIFGCSLSGDFFVKFSHLLIFLFLGHVFKFFLFCLFVQAFLSLFFDSQSHVVSDADAYEVVYAHFKVEVTLFFIFDDHEHHDYADDCESESHYKRVFFVHAKQLDIFSLLLFLYLCRSSHF